MDARKHHRRATNGGNQNRVDIESLKIALQHQLTQHQQQQPVYTQKNTQLARENAQLKARLSALERQVSELVQENVLLRSRTSMAAHDYRTRLSEQLALVADGVTQRLNEIHYMIERVRSKEDLPPSHLTTQSTRKSSAGRNRYSSLRSTGSDPHMLIPESGDAVPRKRRKSSRRESFFIPAQQMTDDAPNDELVPALPPSISLESEKNQALKKATAIATTANTNNDSQHDNYHQIYDNPEATASNNNSMIDYSIPESTGDDHEESNDANKQSTTNKLDVFKDQDEPSSIEPMLNPTPLPIDKIKHSLKPRRPQEARKEHRMMDEKMPNSNETVTIDFTKPIRRTRGKAVDYKLPSLRAKMRRPSEQLVDATTSINIHELQVTKSRKRKQNNIDYDTPEIKSEPTPDSDQSVLTQNEGRNRAVRTRSNKLSNERKSLLLDDDNDERPMTPPQNVLRSLKKKNLTIFNRKETVTTPESDTKSHGLRSGTPINLNINKAALSDITNTPHGKPSGKKHLLKEAIKNDLFDENSSQLGESPSIEKSKAVSFKADPAELAVFNLVDNHNKNRHTPRTYRSKRL